MSIITFKSGIFLMGLLASVPTARASAELAVSQMIVELKPGESRAADIEIYNDSDERSFVSVEPREIIDPGMQSERPMLSPDPEKLGLLVSPRRLVIEAQQRRRVRVAAIGPLNARERIYRVTVKPVSGAVASTITGLKLLVGYDLLVLVRPLLSKPKVEIRRNGSVLTIVNAGNSSVELAEGKQCNGNICGLLPSKRLYAGASWEQPMPLSAVGQYRVRSTQGWSTLKF